MNFIHNVSRLGNRPFHGQVTSSRCCPEISLIALRSPSVREARLGHPKHLDREHMRYSFPQVYLCRKEYRLVRCARGEARTRGIQICRLLIQRLNEWVAVQRSICKKWNGLKGWGNSNKKRGRGLRLGLRKVDGTLLPLPPPVDNPSP